MEVVEEQPLDCLLVKDFGKREYSGRYWTILKFKSKAADFNADTLYAPIPTDKPKRFRSDEDYNDVYVPAKAYKCH